MTAEAVPVAPAPEGWTIADVDALPENGLRYELVDGVPRVMGPLKIKHQRACKRVDAALEAAAPPGLFVWQGIGVILADDQRPIPDFLVIDIDDEELHNVPAEHVRLVGEVVSRSSRSDDRSASPRSTPRPASRSTCVSSWIHRTSWPTASARTACMSRSAAPGPARCCA